MFKVVMTSGGKLHRSWGLIQYRVPGIIGYTMWLKGTEWKMDYLLKEKKKKKSCVAYQWVYLTKKEGIF